MNKRLVDVAEGIVPSLPAGEIHTVAAAAMDVNGDIHTGVNVFHFTGGPCAELVAIGAAEGAGVEPFITIVAVGDGASGVIAPRGRWRQVLLDMHPDVYAIVPKTAICEPDLLLCPPFRPIPPPRRQRYGRRRHASEEVVGYVYETVPTVNKGGQGSAHAGRGAVTRMVHVGNDDRPWPDRVQRLCDLLRSESGAAVAVNLEADYALAKVTHDPGRHVVVVSSARPEETHRVPQKPEQLVGVAHDLVVDLADVTSPTDAVCRPSSDGQRKMAGAVVGDVEEQVCCQVTEYPGVGIHPAGVEEKRRRDLHAAQEPD